VFQNIPKCQSLETTRSVDVKEDTRLQIWNTKHIALRRKEEGESVEFTKEISIWYWSERAEVPKRIRVVDLERTRGRRSVTLGKFTPEMCVCGDVRTPEGRRAVVHQNYLIFEDMCQ
jgi:hypothetical protein